MEIHHGVNCLLTHTFIYFYHHYMQYVLIPDYSKVLSSSDLMPLPVSSQWP